MPSIRGSVPALSLRRALDLVEQLVVLVLYCWLVARLWPERSSPKDLYTLLLLLSEGVVCVLLLIRRPTAEISLNVRDWLVAAAGTFLALAVSNGGSPIFGPLGGLLLLFGLLIHLGAKLSLWRSFGVVAANRGVKVRGLYAVVRHPMYAGYMLCHVGFLLVAPSLWNVAIYVAVWSLLLARIVAEEHMLRLDPQYRAYADRVRYRLVPGVF